jgi:hypothetical protein
MKNITKVLQLEESANFSPKPTSQDGILNNVLQQKMNTYYVSLSTESVSVLC